MPVHVPFVAEFDSRVSFFGQGMALDGHVKPVFDINAPLAVATLESRI